MDVNSLPWYYCTETGGIRQTVTLSGDEWHHCHHVLRMSQGDHLILFNGHRWCMEGQIIETSKHQGLITVLSDVSALYASSRNYSITLAFAPTKNIDRTEFALEKLVELGVDHICFLDCEHSERNHLRLDRMEKIILSAAKQSRKIILPDLDGPIPPMDLIQRYRSSHPALPIYFGHLDATSTPLVQNYMPGSDVLLLVGPEGGFSSTETSRMKENGALAVTLGPYRLRVETAVIAACTTIHMLNEQKLPL